MKLIATLLRIMGFIRQKLSVYISYVLLLFFFSMGAVECLHHDFLPETINVNTHSNDSKAASLHQHQLSCQLCKSIAHHINTHFDHPVEVLMPVFCAVSTRLITSPILLQQSPDYFSLAGRGPPVV